MKAYRCDYCGQWRDGQSIEVSWYVPTKDQPTHWSEIDLCPDCAPAVIEPLEAIAKTETE